MKKLVAVVLVAALPLLVGGWCYFGHEDDPFTAKYHRIRQGTTHEEAVRLLGPSDDDVHPGMSMGSHFYYWKSADRSRTIDLTWDLTGELYAKRMLAEDGTAVLSERYYLQDTWWQRFLSRVGFR